MSYLERTALLLGEAAMERLHRAKVTVVGLGGVGGSCAEALARSGVGKLHLIDGDKVAESNLNRQIFAAKDTIGKEKTAAALERLSAVSDGALTAQCLFVTVENAGEVIPPDTDFIVDAIDDVPGKLALITLAKERNVPIISCLGAGNRLSPGGFFVTDIYKTSGDPLARKLRQELRKRNIDSLTVVFSRETPRALPGQRVIGSFAPATAAAGLTAAAYVIEKCTEGEETL